MKMNKALVAGASAGVTLGLTAAVWAGGRVAEFVMPESTTKSDMAIVRQTPVRTAALTSPAAKPESASAPQVETVYAAKLEPFAATLEPVSAPASASGTNVASLGSTASPGTAAPAPAAQGEDSGDGEIMWSKPPAGGATKTAALGPMHFALPGKPMDMEAPVMDGKFRLGDVAVRIVGSDVSVQKDRLIATLTPLLRSNTLDTLKAAPGDKDGYVQISALSAQQFDIRFDTAAVELQINPTLDQRATGKLSGSTARETVKSENLSKPAEKSGYLNTRFGADYTTTRGFDLDGGMASSRVDFEGAFRWMTVVLETRATVENDGTASRRGTRFIYDLPDDILRISLGDVDPLRTSYQSGSDMLGVTVEKSYQKLQPGQNIHPTGAHSFRIERPSNADIVINGHVTQRLQLRPGDYDINDLPLTAGANEIQLIITDDVGNKRTLQFTVFSGRSLLAPGISEWALSAGFATHYATTSGPHLSSLYSQLEYDLNTPVVTGYYQRGLTDNITGELHLQGDPQTMMGGTGIFFQTSFGFFGIDAGASNNIDVGPGIASHITYELANIEGSDGIKRSVRLATEYRSEKFGAVGTLAPQNDAALSFSTSYAQELPWKISGSLSGSYTINRDNPDHYGADLNLSRSFGPDISGSVSLGYDKSATPSTASRLPEGVKAMLRVNYRVSENASLDGSYDASEGRSQMSYRHQEGNGVGSWNAQAELEHNSGAVDGQENIGLNGSLGYIGNRAEVAVSQHAGFVGFTGDTTSHRTSLTAGTAIAFADGGVAVGRPVTNSFAIVEPHANLPESNVSIGSSKETARASSDYLGAALLPDLSPYSAARIPIDVENLPVGYDLGTGGFDVLSPYKGGYHFVVGSDYTITAFGTLTDETGEPIALLTGVAFEDGHPNDHQVTVFTNKAGRFGAQGLRPGRWIVEMETEPKTRFVFDIPKDTVGLLRLDTLKPFKSGT